MDAREKIIFLFKKLFLYLANLGLNSEDREEKLN